ncbi:peroxisomal ATPase PEX6-like [Branchiostoma lanceolatum]|uniref:peroxisomal ATPase PEX6-like n=1 Tax=Branchiostoma lanceolatum TaxID=7740 RepID=UPI003456FBC4
MAVSRRHGILRRFSFPSGHHPLHLGVTTQDANVIGCNIEDAVSVISIPRASDESDTRKELFACVSPLPLDSEPTEVGGDDGRADIISLFADEKFFRHYGFRHEEKVTLRLVKAFPLSRLVIGTRKQQCYNWANGVMFGTGLLVAVCQQKLLARKGDVMLAPVLPMLGDADTVLQHYFDMTVLECEPGLQGVVTVNTSVIVTLMEEESEAGGDTSLEADRDGISPTITVVSDFASCLQTLEYTLSLLPQANLSKDNAEKVLSLLHSSQHVKSSDVRMRVRMLQQQLSAAGVVNAGLRAVTEHRVFATLTTLQRLKCFSGSWVNISIAPDNEDQSQDGKIPSINVLDESAVLPDEIAMPQEEVSHKIPDPDLKEKSADDLLPSGSPVKKVVPRVCLIQLCAVDAGSPHTVLEDGVLHVSPQLWFNLQSLPPVKSPDSCMCSVKPLLPLSPDVPIQSQSHSRSCQPPYASQVGIAMVTSPAYTPTCHFDSALKKYFSTTRVITLGDLFCVSTEDDAELFQEMVDGEMMRCPFVYFKVTQLSPTCEEVPSYLVDLKHTDLYQEGLVNSYIPVSADTFMSDIPPSLWTSVHPPGLDQSVDRLCEIIVPYLTHSQPESVKSSVLLTGPQGVGKSTVIRAVRRRLNMHLLQVNCYNLCGESSAATEARVNSLFQKALSCAPCILHLRNVGVLGRDRDGHEEDPRVAAMLHEAVAGLRHEASEYPVIVVASSAADKDVTSDVRGAFLHHVDIKTPTKTERGLMLRTLCQDVPLSSDVSIDKIAARSAGMVLGDLCSLLACTTRKAHRRILDSCCPDGRLSQQEQVDLVAAGVEVKQVDFEKALDHLQAAHSDAIGAPKIPNVSWEDVGGLAQVRAEILDTIQLPLQHPQLFAAGMRRSGVLLYGPPGTGKTLLAKAVATECSLNFLSVKGPELINMYVGQSEENVREVFSRARSAAPCAIFFDELDSLAPNRGRSGDSGGVMDRVVSQLLAELDGLHSAADVFVIGATNRPDLLDPALLRPGRFDKLLFLGVSGDRPSQLKILQALTRKFQLAADTQLENVVDKCPYNMTGADFYALCSDAMLNAIRRKIEQLEAGLPVDQTDVTVEEQDFITALQTLEPSVSTSELDRYKQLQGLFTTSMSNSSIPSLE